MICALLLLIFLGVRLIQLRALAKCAIITSNYGLQTVHAKKKERGNDDGKNQNDNTFGRDGWR